MEKPVLPKRKYLIAAFLILTLLCIVAAGVCGIADFANHEAITWSAFVICSVMLAWAVMLPLFLSRGKRLLLSLATLSVLINPFLYFVDRSISARSWFLPIGLPVAITGIASLWIAVALFRFVKVNKWYLTAGIVAVLGFVTDNVLISCINRFAGTPLSLLVNIISIFSLAVVGLILLIIGYIMDK